VVEATSRAQCPACNGTTLSLTSYNQSIPYFGEVLHTVVHCQACAFRHTDFMPLAQRDPARHTLSIKSAEDLTARVVRSNSGTYQVPELGFTATPTPASEAFVSNVEGVLERVRSAMLRARLLTDEPEKKRLLDERLAHLQEIVEGRRVATLVIEDPFGHSAILSDRVRAEPLTPEEAERLNPGRYVIDANDLR